jgi:hypothetical protein
MMSEEKPAIIVMIRRDESSQKRMRFQGRPGGSGLEGTTGGEALFFTPFIVPGRIRGKEGGEKTRK